MPVMVSELYDALKSANVSDDLARKAAEAMANQMNELSAVKTDLAVLKAMLAINVGLTVSIFAKLFLS